MIKYGNYKIGRIPKSKDEIREQRKRDRLAQREECAKEVLALRAQGYDVESMNGFLQYRINGELDIYPKGRKWCDIRSGIWGSYEAGELLATILNFAFNAKFQEPELSNSHHCFHCKQDKSVSAFRSLGCTWCKQCELT